MTWTGGSAVDAPAVCETGGVVTAERRTGTGIGRFVLAAPGPADPVVRTADSGSTLVDVGAGGGATGVVSTFGTGAGAGGSASGRETGTAATCAGAGVPVSIVRPDDPIQRATAVAAVPASTATAVVRRAFARLAATTAALCR